jgi:hypothetical protein
MGSSSCVGIFSTRERDKGSGKGSDKGSSDKVGMSDKGSSSGDKALHLRIMFGLGVQKAHRWNKKIHLFHRLKKGILRKTLESEVEYGRRSETESEVEYGRRWSLKLNTEDVLMEIPFDVIHQNHDIVV